MLHIEAFSCAKDASAPETNEDQMAIVPGVLYAVADGATDISGRRYDDRLGHEATGGRLAARAVAEALYGFVQRGGEPEPAAVLARTNRAIAEVYERLAIARTAVDNGDHRFRAAFAAAFVVGQAVRLICVGDCAVRINGKDVLRHDFPADSVFAAARSIGWSLLEKRGVPTEEIRPAARSLIVKGLAGPAPAPFSPGDLELIRDAVPAHRALERTVVDAETIARALDGGLEAVRADPAAFDACVPDGVSALDGCALTRDIPLAEIDTIEVFSDGYPMMGDAPTVAAWEAALAHADATDPERIGDFAGTKGRAGALFGDDRTILIIKSRLD